MRNYVVAGCVPSSEPELSGSDSHARKFSECSIFADYLGRLFTEPPLGAQITVKLAKRSMVVVCWYDSNNDESQEYAERIIAEMPEYWDAEALEALREAGILETVSVGR